MCGLNRLQQACGGEKKILKALAATPIVLDNLIGSSTRKAPVRNARSARMPSDGTKLMRREHRFQLHWNLVLYM